MINYTGLKGYRPGRPYVNDGDVNSVFCGTNAMLDPDGWRAHRGCFDMSQQRPVTTLAYTATLVQGNPIVQLSLGATAKSDFRRRQHVLINKHLYLIYEVVDDRHIKVGPAPLHAGSNLAVAKVPKLSALNTSIGSQFAGNSIYFRNAMIFGIGDGSLYKDGVELNTPLVCSDSLGIAYPKPDGTWDSRPAGFSAPAFTGPVVEGAAGLKNMPVGVYPIVLIRKRIGFSGQGNPSARYNYVAVNQGKKIKITLPAFAASEGQTGWIIASCRTDAANSVDPSLWEVATTDQQSTDIEVEWYSDELVTAVTYDNDPPPKAQTVFSLGNYLVLAGVGGPIDGSGNETAGGCEIAPSKYNNPEAYSVFARVPTANGEEIIGAIPGQFLVFLPTPDSINVASLTGNQAVPFAIRGTVNFGIKHQGNLCMVKDRLYICAKGNLYRTSGEQQVLATASSTNDLGSAVSANFANEIRSDLKNVDQEKMFIGFDLEKDVVVIFEGGSVLSQAGYWQSRAWSLNLRDDTWNTPALLGDGTTADFIVTDCKKINGSLYIATHDGKIWQWDNGNVVTTGYIGFPFANAMPQFLKTWKDVKFTGNGGTYLSAFINLNKSDLVNGTNPIAQCPMPAETDDFEKNQPIWPLNLVCNSLAIRVDFTVTGGAAVLDQVNLEAIPHQGFRS